MDRFSKLNPKVSFTFFVCAIILSVVFFNPFLLIVSVVSSLLYNIKISGFREFKGFFKFLLPLVLLVSIFNFACAHWGNTVLFVLFDSNFTYEALLYGLTQGMTLACVWLWFKAYGKVVTSEKFLSVFGSIAPSSALVFSLALSFIPRLQKNAQEINDARKNINPHFSNLKKSIGNFSALLSLTLEQSIEISNSMKARGFNKNRTSYSKYKFGVKDLIVLIICTLLFVILITLKLAGQAQFIFDPIINFEGFNFITVIVYSIFSLMPVLVDLTEDIKWLYLRRKI